MTTKFQYWLIAECAESECIETNVPHGQTCCQVKARAAVPSSDGPGPQLLERCLAMLTIASVHQRDVGSLCFADRLY